MTVVILPLAVLATSLHSLVDQVTWNSDASSSMVVADAIATEPGHGAVAVQQGGYVLLDVLFRLVPFHRTVWQLLPLAIAVATVGLLAWVSARLVGRWGAAVTLVVFVAATPPVLLSMTAQAFHGLVWLGTAALAAFLMVIVDSPLSRRTEWTLLLALSLALGAVLAQDALLLITGVLPFCVAVALLALARLPAGLKLLRTGVALTGGICLSAVVAQLAWRHFGFAVGVVGGAQRSVPTPSALIDHAHQLASGILDLFGGQSYSDEGTTNVLVRGVATLLAVGAVCAPFGAALRWWRVRGSAVADTARFAIALFWTSSVTILAAAFLLTNVVASSVDSAPAERLVGAVRYLPVIFFSAAATLPLWIGGLRRTQVIAAFGVGALCVVSAFAVQTAVDGHQFQLTSSRDLSQLAAVLQRHHLTIGYAAYWDAEAITWKTESAVAVYPVAEGSACGTPDPGVVCAFADHSVRGWFVPRPAQQTFLVVDPGVDFVQVMPSPTLGSPVDVFRVGRFTVLVFGDDIAARFPAFCAGRADHKC